MTWHASCGSDRARASCGEGRWVTAAWDSDGEESSAAPWADGDITADEAGGAFAPAALRAAAPSVAEACSCELASGGGRGSVEADVTDLVQPIGQDVLHEETEKLDGR